MRTITEQTGTTRRDVIMGLGAAGAALTMLPNLGLAGVADAADGAKMLPIAVSDRGVGLRQQLGVFDLARRCGVRRVEVDLGRLGTGAGMANRLLDPGTCRQFADTAEATGVTISSLALSAFTDQSFATHPKAEEYADDLLYLMREMRVPVGLLPIDADNDYTRSLTVERLKVLTATAGPAGLTIAIDSALPADAVRGIVDAVGSPAIRATLRCGYGNDPVADLAVLGQGRVAQLRYRSDDASGPSATVTSVFESLLSAGWSGQFVVDRPAAVTGDASTDLSLAADRLRRVFSPAYT